MDVLAQAGKTAEKVKWLGYTPVALIWLNKVNDSKGAAKWESWEIREVQETMVLVT